MLNDTTRRDTVYETIDASQPATALPPLRRGKAGAPDGNTNRVTHGLHGSALPRDARRTARRLAEFRRSLCAAVEAASGEISLTAAATIDSAAQWQRHLLLAARWLRLQHDELSPDQRLAFSREVARASTERDKCIRALRLDRDAASDMWASLYDPLPSPAKPPDFASPASAADPPPDTSDPLSGD